MPFGPHSALIRPKAWSRASDAGPAPLSAEERVEASNDVQFRRLVEILIGLAITLFALVRVYLPESHDAGLFMIAAAVPARILIQLKYLRLARAFFLAVLTSGLLIMPPLINGIRTPLLAAMPLLVLLAGWLLGPRVMLALAGLFLVDVILLGSAEHFGVLVLTVPLRTPEIWQLVWAGVIVLTALTGWYLLGAVRDVQRGEMVLNQRLLSLLSFNETILSESPLAMAVYTADGACIAVNDACADLAGGSRADMLAMNFNEIEGWRQAGFAEDARAALARNLPQRREAQVCTTFGRELYLDARFLPTTINGARHVVAQFVDLTERRRLEEELRAMAFNDPLTRLPNRRLLQDRMDQAIRTARRNRTHLAVLFIDLDRFKDLNDAHGHDVGDQYLIATAQRLRGCVRDSDTVARLAGDEFVVLLEGLATDALQAQAHAALVRDKIRAAIGGEWRIGAIRLSGSASIGIALSLDEDVDPQTLLGRADAAMYRAKAAARG